MKLYCDSFLKLVETYRFLPVNFYYSCYCCLVTQLCLTLSDLIDCSTLGFPVFHLLPELAQTYMHWVSDALHPTISSSVVPFSSCLQSFSASGSFPMSQLFASGGQSMGASASVPPMNIQGWFPLGLTGLISLQTKGLSRVLQHHRSKASVLQSAFFMVQISHPYMTTGKTVALTVQTFVGKVMSLLYNTLSWS